MKRNIAALTFELSVSGNTIQLLPSGSFRAKDGRPADCKAWQLDAAIAQNLIALAAARKTPLVIDYEHQTLRAATNGQPAPASGWFKTLTYRDGVGLFATDVEWTEPARQMIANKEYRFISAVFTYDKQGRIREILHAALTNTPALDGMDEVTMAALSSLAGLSESPTLTGGTAVDEELLERLRWMLNMPITATAEEVIAELNKAIDMLSGGAGMAAASVNLIDLLKSKEEQIAALSANARDVSRFVPIETVNALQQRIADLTSRVTGREVDELVTAALSDGRLLPELENWARENGNKDINILKNYLNSAPRIAALSSTQTNGKPPAGVNNEEPLDTVSLAVCSQFGNDPATIADLLKKEGL